MVGFSFAYFLIHSFPHSSSFALPCPKGQIIFVIALHRNTSTTNHKPQTTTYHKNSTFIFSLHHPENVATFPLPFLVFSCVCLTLSPSLSVLFEKKNGEKEGRGKNDIRKRKTQATMTKPWKKVTMPFDTRMTRKRKRKNRLRALKNGIHSHTYPLFIISGLYA